LKTIEVEYMFECPFKYEEAYQYSEFTSGTDAMCAILAADCCKADCPLIKEGSIKVKWMGD